MTAAERARQRLNKYVAERQKMIYGIDIEHIHSLNAGDEEREAYLLLSDIRSLLAENDKMRSGLERIAKSKPKDIRYDGFSIGDCIVCEELIEIAREALEGGENE